MSETDPKTPGDETGGETRCRDFPFSEETLQAIREFRLIDDAFMQVCFEYDTECLQEVLRIILDMPDLVIVAVRVQQPLKNLRGRSLRVDVLARDSTGRLFNLEVQRTDTDPRRFRLHSGMVDGAALDAGDDFEDLPDLYVIFIMERDPFRKGLPLYHFVRYMPEIGLALEDGSHIICVNGEIRGKQTKLAQVMHDFFCADPDEMYIESLARVARRFKQDEEGVLKMGSVVEKIRAERTLEVQTAIILQMLRMGEFTLEKMAEITQLSLDEVKAIIARSIPDAQGEGAK